MTDQKIAEITSVRSDNSGSRQGMLLPQPPAWPKIPTGQIELSDAAFGIFLDREASRQVHV